MNHGKNVASPVTGKIVDQGQREVIKSYMDDNGQKHMERLTLPYVTIQALDKNHIEKEGMAVYKEFYETEYKGVLSGKEKFGKNRGGADSGEGEYTGRYLEGNKITILRCKLYRTIRSI